MRSPYKFHGVHLEDIGTQLQGDCPFCGKVNHFFVADPQLHDISPPRVPWGWCCHHCGESGNLYDFLALLASRCELAPEYAADLEKERGITPATAARFGLFTTPNARIVIPAWNLNGKLCNLYRAIWSSEKGRVILASTPTCQHQLYLGQHLSGDSTKPIWVCEGQWDTLRLAQLLPEADVCGTPGCVFKPTWKPPFAGRRVNLLFDFDDAGRRHTQNVAQILENSDIYALNWESLTEKTGWKFGARTDISDLFREQGENRVFPRIKRNLDSFRFGAPYIGGHRDETESSKSGRSKTIDWRPLPISRLEELATPIDWIWDGYVARRCCTLLVAIQKVGKTSLLADFCFHLAAGGNLETPIKPARVLVITEEDASLWIQRRDAHALTDNVHVAIRPCKGRPTKQVWNEIIDLITEYSRGQSLDIVILDTFARLCPAINENDAIQMTDAYVPLERLYDLDMGIILVHHAKKGDAAEGHAARGSTALAANVDIILELRRAHKEDADNQHRSLRAYSRFETTPKLIELHRVDGRYVSLGSKRERNTLQRQSLIRAAIDHSGSVTIQDLTTGPDPMTKRTASSELTRMVESGQLVRTGTGRKGDPYIYSTKRKDHDCSTIL